MNVLTIKDWLIEQDTQKSVQFRFTDDYEEVIRLKDFSMFKMGETITVVCTDNPALRIYAKIYDFCEDQIHVYLSQPEGHHYNDFPEINDIENGWSTPSMSGIR